MVEALSLCGNQISDGGVAALAQHLVGSKVKQLYISHNQISDRGAAALAQHLAGGRVRSLSLSHNYLSSTGAAALGAAFNAACSARRSRCWVDVEHQHGLLSRVWHNWFR